MIDFNGISEILEMAFGLSMLISMAFETFICVKGQADFPKGDLSKDFYYLVEEIERKNRKKITNYLFWINFSIVIIAFFTNVDNYTYFRMIISLDIWTFVEIARRMELTDKFIGFVSRPFRNEIL